MGPSLDITLGVSAAEPYFMPARDERPNCRRSHDSGTTGHEYSHLTHLRHRCTLSCRLFLFPSFHRVARIAVTTGPVGRHFFTEVLEDVARSAFGGLAVTNDGAKLRLIHRAPLFVVVQVLAEIDRRQLAPEPLPASPAVLAHEAMALEQGENDARFPRRNVGLIREVGEGDRGRQRVLLETDRDAGRLFDLRILAAQEIGLNAAIFDPIQERARRRLSIAPGTTGFLIVRLDRARKVVMEHEADVLLVDPEP